MSLALVVVTNRAGPQLERLIEWAKSKSYFDAFYGFIDERRSTKDEQEAARYALFRAGAIYTGVDADNIDAALAQAHSEQTIKTDWALHLGTDELMGKWFDDEVELLMRQPYDVFSFPRYNLLVRDGILHYISSPPWYPDWARRLFRPGYLYHAGKVHEGPLVRGRMAMASPHIFHFDFVDETLEQREAKWQRYLAQGVVAESRARGLPDDYYRRWCIPEEYEYTTSPCLEELS